MAKVTIIVDELAATAEVADALRDAGHEVEVFGAVPAALAGLAARAPDVIVLAGPMSLPDALMSLDVLRSRSGLREVAAILVSDHATPEQIARAGRCGVRCLIDRAHLRADALAAAVEEVTRQR
jgi:CheY-like chemotaxis protein